MPLEQKGLDLSHGIENHTHYDEHAGASEESRNVIGHLGRTENEIGKNGNDGQENSTGQGIL